MHSLKDSKVQKWSLMIDYLLIIIIFIPCETDMRINTRKKIKEIRIRYINVYAYKDKKR